MANRRSIRFAYWQIALVFVLVLALLSSSWHYTAVPSATMEGEKPFGPPLLPEQTQVDLCSPHGLKAYPGERKVYDLVLMANELDFLEIRLNSLKDVVDYFVIVTAATTFTGIPKPLYLHDNWDRYEAFHHKIVHHVVEDAPFGSSWEHETYIRNSLLKAAHLGERAPEPGDVLMVSDMDEILRAESVTMLRKCDFPRRTTLHTAFFYYAFQWRNPNEWFHPQVTYYQGLDTIPPDTLRSGAIVEGEVIADLWNVGWHCSNCFKTIKQVIEKIEGFSHAPEWSTAENRDPATIVDRYRHGIDLFGRQNQVYNLSAVDDVPSFIDNNRERFKYMLDRTSETAEFEDYAVYLPSV